METKEVLSHILMPKHEVLSDEQKTELLKTFNVRDDQLPKIFSTDPAINHLKPKNGDVIKISRKSPTAGATAYYRIVTEV
ncbi:MAG: DNA-directed RNA polymerase subunit H [Candidatus Aenigmarchaeota archaeon]|nr:DNA-directed RNA polymerase subunit H [Candidatus Aenigmarchaeota archaeon]